MKLQTLHTLQIFYRVQDHGRWSKHSLFRLKITVGCRLCACPNIHVCMCMSMFMCLSVSAVPCNTVLVCAARSWCDDLFFMDGGCRVHDRKRVNYLPSLTGAIMHPSRPSLLGFPGESWKGPEATPLTSHASLFWLPPLADSQTRCPLEISQPCGLKNDLLCSRPLRAYSHLCSRPLRAQQSPGAP